MLSEQIYNIVMNIPEGEVLTYGEIAARIGNKNLARYVGNVLHKNPDNSKIPCHRVVNAKGCLSKSFAFGGIEAQKKLLENEGVIIENYRVKSLKNK